MNPLEQLRAHLKLIRQEPDRLNLMLLKGIFQGG
jgi:hypothetical protein